jgi:hypothetical protein
MKGELWVFSSLSVCVDCVVYVLTSYFSYRRLVGGVEKFSDAFGVGDRGNAIVHKIQSMYLANQKKIMKLGLRFFKSWIIIFFGWAEAKQGALSQLLRFGQMVMHCAVGWPGNK